MNKKRAKVIFLIAATIIIFSQFALAYPTIGDPCSGLADSFQYCSGNYRLICDATNHYATVNPDCANYAYSLNIFSDGCSGGHCCSANDGGICIFQNNCCVSTSFCDADTGLVCWSPPTSCGRLSFQTQAACTRHSSACQWCGFPDNKCVQIGQPCNAPSQCSGCSLPASTACIPNNAQSDSQCGLNGMCVDCAATGDHCNKLTGICQACTANCLDGNGNTKCDGSSDTCGGFCDSSKCVSPQTCQSGICQVPCSSKTQGACTGNCKWCSAGCNNKFNVPSSGCVDSSAPCGSSVSCCVSAECPSLQECTNNNCQPSACTTLGQVACYNDASCQWCPMCGSNGHSSTYYYTGTSGQCISNAASCTGSCSKTNCNAPCDATGGCNAPATCDLGTCQCTAPGSCTKVGNTCTDSGGSHTDGCQASNYLTWSCSGGNTCVSSSVCSVSQCGGTCGSTCSKIGSKCTDALDSYTDYGQCTYSCSIYDTCWKQCSCPYGCYNPQGNGQCMTATLGPDGCYICGHVGNCSEDNYAGCHDTYGCTSGYHCHCDGAGNCVGETPSTCNNNGHCDLGTDGFNEQQHTLTCNNPGETCLCGDCPCTDNTVCQKSSCSQDWDSSDYKCSNTPIEEGEQQNNFCDSTHGCSSPPCCCDGNGGCVTCCTDTDGGNVPTIPGVCTDSTGTYTDSCGGSNLREYFCSGLFCQMSFDSCVAGCTTDKCNPTCEESTFISQSAVPNSLDICETFTTDIKMQNVGTCTWKTSGPKPYNLGSQNPQDNGIWGPGREGLNVGESILPGQTKTFSFQNVAPTTAGLYNFQWQMVHDGAKWFGDYSTNVGITVTSPFRGAQYISQTVQSTMTAGQTYPITITMRNTGKSTWNPPNYKIGRNDNLWGPSRAGVTASTSTCNEYTFNFNVVAPATPGTYNFQWQMLEEGQAWFGELTPNVAVTVNPPPNTLPVGSLDMAVCNLLAGWSADPDMPTQSINIEFYKDGPKGTGTLLGTVATNVDSPDVCTALGASYKTGATCMHGYSVITPASLKDGTNHQLYAYGVDTSGPTAMLPNSPITLNCPACTDTDPTGDPMIYGKCTNTIGSDTFDTCASLTTVNQYQCNNGNCVLSGGAATTCPDPGACLDPLCGAGICGSKPTTRGTVEPACSGSAGCIPGAQKWCDGNGFCICDDCIAGNACCNTTSHPYRVKATGTLCSNESTCFGNNLCASTVCNNAGNCNLPSGCNPCQAGKIIGTCKQQNGLCKTQAGPDVCDSFDNATKCHNCDQTCSNGNCNMLPVLGGCNLRHSECVAQSGMGKLPSNSSDCSCNGYWTQCV